MDELTEELADSIDTGLMCIAHDTVLGRIRITEWIAERKGVRLSDSAVVLIDHLSKGPLRVTELGGLVGASSPTITKQVRDLEKKGLIHKTPDERDGRATIVSLSPLGFDIQAFVVATRKASLRTFLRDWSTQDLRPLSELLKRMAADLSEGRKMWGIDAPIDE